MFGIIILYDDMISTVNATKTENTEAENDNKKFTNVEKYLCYR